MYLFLRKLLSSNKRRITKKFSVFVFLFIDVFVFVSFLEQGKVLRICICIYRCICIVFELHLCFYLSKLLNFNKRRVKKKIPVFVFVFIDVFVLNLDCICIFTWASCWPLTKGASRKKFSAVKIAFAISRSVADQYNHCFSVRFFLFFNNFKISILVRCIYIHFAWAQLNLLWKFVINLFDKTLIGHTEKVI